MDIMGRTAARIQVLVFFVAAAPACTCSAVELVGATDAFSVPDPPRDVTHELPCDGDVPPACHAALPYMEDPCPQVITIAFLSSLRRADVFLSLDSSRSMDEEIYNLRTSLRDTVVPGVRAEIPDVWFGVGRFEDCNECPHNMEMLEPMSGDIGPVEEALRVLFDLCGGNEPYTENLYAIATGDVSPFLGWGGVVPSSWTCTPPGAIGWPCFRRNTIPIVVQTGDESFIEALTVCPPGTTLDQAVDALNSISAKYIGVNSTGAFTGSYEEMVYIANGTGSVDAGGDPLVFNIPPDGSGLGLQIVDAIATLARNVPVDITAEPRDDPADEIDALAFVERIEPDTDGGVGLDEDSTRVCSSDLPVTDADGDTFADTFSSVLGGTVCFDIHLRRNEILPPGSEPRVLRLTIDVVADGVSILDTREVLLCVPGV